MPPTNPSTLHPNPSLAALPYNPALSLWLSVDPLSDKYPNLSPYVYCANNPVGLVDVDGREWESREDEIKANKMISLGMNKIQQNNKFINRLENKYQHCTDDVKRNNISSLISEIKEENTMIQKGIDGIKEMGASKIHFQFKQVERGDNCFAKKERATGGYTLISIYSDDLMETSWHECKHVSDWLNEAFPRTVHDFKQDGILGHSSDDVETNAYQSEFAFSRRRFDGVSLHKRNSYKEIQGDQRICQ